MLHKDKAGIDHEKEHMKEHQQHIDTSNMSEQELQFHYFKMHDSDGELISFYAIVCFRHSLIYDC